MRKAQPLTCRVVWQHHCKHWESSDRKEESIAIRNALLPFLQGARATFEELGLDPTPKVRSLKLAEPPSRKAGVIVADVEELIAKLHEEAKVF